MTDALIFLLQSRPRDLAGLGKLFGVAPVVIILWYELELVERFSIVLVAFLIIVSYGTMVALFTARLALKAAENAAGLGTNLPNRPEEGIASQIRRGKLPGAQGPNTPRSLRSFAANGEAARRQPPDDEVPETSVHFPLNG